MLHSPRRLGAVLLPAFTLFCFAPVLAQTVVRGSKSIGHAAASPGELRAARAFDLAKTLGAPELYAFLKPMPKGADLHMHLSGAVYAETFIAEAAHQGLCIAPVDRGTPATPTGQNALRFVPAQKAGNCASGETPAAEALTQQPLFDALIDSFSMRAFVPTEGISGHDQFFATFARFGGLKAPYGEWLDQIATRAASQNEQYLEIMHTPTFTYAATLGYKLGWPAGAENTITAAELARLRDALLAGGLRDEVAIDRQEFSTALARRRTIEHCGPTTPSATDPTPDPDALTLDLAPSTGKVVAESSPACAVQIRWLYQVLRAFPPQQVFAQALLGFEVAQAELDSGHPQVLGINFVQPEDAFLAMRDFHLQMLMLDFLHSIYPRVRISLHAGELAPGMVPPDGLAFHIRESIELGHAERIGHGMDILYESRPNQLLAEMAEKHIMVEANLTSNDIILGRTRTDHPLAAYRAAHVPVALSTDDEGVSRIDPTHEFVKAAEEQNLNYADLKLSARTSLEHSFLPGASLWAHPDDFTHKTAACAGPVTAASTPALACATLLRSSARATQQMELERRFAAFESNPR